MPDIWFAIPTANPTQCGETFSKWKAMGYKTACLTDGPVVPVANCDIHLPFPTYDGYALSVNLMCMKILRMHPETEWIITGGDDVWPADADPQAIAAQCRDHFRGTLGVMQPTGDRHMVDAAGLCAAERVTISPWMGREWCQRAYNGNGPLFAGYRHFFVDEDLHNVADRLGCLWHRPDLTQYHDWWGRRGVHRPAYLESAQLGWADAKALFESRRENGFPDSGLAAVPELAAI